MYTFSNISERQFFSSISNTLLLILPMLWSAIRFFTYEEGGKKVEVVAIHPNINCHTEKYQWNRHIEVKPSYLKSTNKNLDFFQNHHEYKKVLGSTTTFNYRNMTPLNEYYL